MVKREFVNIGLHIEGRVIDLRIPCQVRKAHLKRVLAEAVSMKRINLPQTFDFRFTGKPLAVNETAILESYAIGDGDQIEIVLKGRTQ